MAYVMTFNTLQEDLRSYLERGFTADSDPAVYTQIPRLITMAERKIATGLKLQGFLQYVNTTLPAGVATYAKPDRWRDTVSIRAGGKPLFARSYEYLRNYWPDDTVRDTPEFYADYDYGHWLIAPTPVADVAAEIAYYEFPRPLDDDNQTNWLTAFAPSLLLYASLLEATQFLKNDERIVTWQNAYNDAAQSLLKEDSGKVLDRASTRTEV